MSTKRLTRAQREAIIIDYINGKETPGYKVTENANGKFTVKTLKEPKPIEESKPKIELEEEDINEPNPKSEAQAECENYFKHKARAYDEDNLSDDNFESLKQPVKIRSKQDARELLQQLSQILNEDEPEPTRAPQYLEKSYKPAEQCWRRKKLVFN